MKYIILLLFVTLELLTASGKTALISVDNEKNMATVKIEKIDVGMSGVVVHQISKEHSSIVSSGEVVAYDAKSQIATVKLTPFETLTNNYLPHGKWLPAVGDTFEFAKNYSRALLIAPDAEVYRKISESVSVEWVHPDLFAAELSYIGHPTPLKEDFQKFSEDAGIGLLFIFLEQKIYTVDIKSFTTLSVSDAPLEVKEEKLPFYSRIEKISASWFGAGTSRMQEYAPHYKALLMDRTKKEN